MVKRSLLIGLLLTILVLSGVLIPHEAQASCQTVRHVVKPGETLYQIARRYGVSVSSIVQANNLWNPNLIYSGQVLLIPLCSGGTTPPPGQCVKVHVVKRGEYLKSIAAKYGTTWQAIANLNNIQNPNLIYVGQRLKIPVKCSSPGGGGSGSGPWKGQFWANRLLSGNPKFTKQYQKIDFNWGKKGPGGGIGGTDFSARFTRSRYFDAGIYRFNVIVDDGVRLWVDGVLIIDQWHDSAPRQYVTDKQLSAGNHTLQIDYYQHKGGAQLKFWIDRVNGQAAWKGVYFNNMQLRGNPVTTRYYKTIDFDWGKKSPAEGVTADYFSARYTGEFQFSGGRYRFIATMDDGMRVWIDGNLIIDSWRSGSARTLTADVDVGQGKHTIKIEFFEEKGDAVCKLRWTQK